MTDSIGISTLRRTLRRKFGHHSLREGQEELSARFARQLGEKWDGIEYETGETGCPILPDALAVFECKTAYTYQGGDHVIFVGEVLKYDFDPRGRPLIFWHGDYYQVGKNDRLSRA